MTTNENPVEMLRRAAKIIENRINHPKKYISLVDALIEIENAIKAIEALETELENAWDEAIGRAKW